MCLCLVPKVPGQILEHFYCICQFFLTALYREPEFGAGNPPPLTGVNLEQDQAPMGGVVASLVKGGLEWELWQEGRTRRGIIRLVSLCAGFKVFSTAGLN